MLLLCLYCKTQLPNDALFCWKCGRVQDPDVEQRESLWETCEITYEKRRTPLSEKKIVSDPVRFKFLARVIGTRGLYTIRESEAWIQYLNEKSPEIEVKEAIAAHRNLVYMLIRDGWQYVGRDSGWWSDKFRRYVGYLEETKV